MKTISIARAIEGYIQQFYCLLCVLLLILNRNLKPFQHNYLHQNNSVFFLNLSMSSVIKTRFYIPAILLIR